MLTRNKGLFLGTVIAVTAWLIGYSVWVRSNWAATKAKLQAADETRAEWEKNFKNEAGLLPKNEAENALEENRKLLNANLQLLQKIELGSPQTLHPYSVAAAGAGDPKNYFDQLRIKIVNRATDTLRIPVPNGLGILGDKSGDDPVPVNLLRLAMVDTFLNACQKAGVARIAWIKHYTPRLILSEAEAEAAAAGSDDDSAPPPPPAPAKKGTPQKTPAGISRLIQFPMKISVQAPEQSFSQLLFELQQSSDNAHGYLCLRGFQVAAKDTSSGMIDGVVAVAALLNENYVRELGISTKAEGEKIKAARKVQW